MSKTEEVQKAMVAAMKAKDKETKESLTLLLSALKLKAKDKQAPLTPEEEDAIVMREIKQTRETLDSAPPDRTDIIEQSQHRLAVLKQFAPASLSDEDILAVIDNALAELGIETPSPRDKAALMRAIMPKLKGKAEGGHINELAMKRLQG